MGRPCPPRTLGDRHHSAADPLAVHNGEMGDEDFTVELESDAESVLTVRLDGELDMANSDWVDDTLGAAGEHHRRIIVQLDALTFIDSAGIGVLQALRARGRPLGIDVTFENPSEPVQRAIEAADTTELIE